MAESRIKRRSFLGYIQQLPVIERLELGVTLIVLIGLAIGASILQRREMLHDKEAHIVLVEQMKISQIQAWYEAQMKEAEQISALNRFKGAVQDTMASPTKGNLARIDDFLRPILRSYNFSNSAVITPECVTVYELTNFAQSDCEMVKDDISQADRTSPFFTELHLISPYAKPGFHLVIPLIAQGQERAFAYVVQTFFAADYLYPLLSQWPSDEKTGEILFLQPQGAMIQVMNPLKLVNISPLSMQVPADDAATVEARAGRGESGVLVGQDYRGKRVIAVAERVPELGWIILSKIDFSEAFSAWGPTLLIIIAFVLVAFAGALAGAYVLFSVRAISVYRGRLELLKRSERSEALLTAVLERIDAPVIVVDSDAKVQFSNQAFKHRFGDELPEGLPPLTANPSDETPAKTVHLELLNMYGKTLHIYVHPMRIALEGQPALSGYVMRDVTELEFALE